LELLEQHRELLREIFPRFKAHLKHAARQMVATATLPDEIRTDWAAYTGCMAGASQISEIEDMLRNAGFDKIKIAPEGFIESFYPRMASGETNRRLSSFRND